MKKLSAAILSIGMMSALGLAAGAQTTTTTQQTTTQQQTPAGPTTTTTTRTYIDTTCGAWNGDTWVPNATAPCAADVISAHRHARVAGTITAVQGHLVTIQQTDKTMVINDTPALNNQLTGKVAVGRQVVAHGYWDGQTFYATLLTTSDHAAAM